MAYPSSLMPTESINAWMVFEATPGKRVVFLPDAPRFTIIAASADMCRFLQLSKEQFVGKSVFDAFPPNPGDAENAGHKNLLASLQQVVQQKQAHQMECQRYDVAIEGGAFEEIYWQNSSMPVVNEAGEVVCIVHTADDVTAKVKAERKHQQITGNNQSPEAPVGVFTVSHDVTNEALTRKRLEEKEQSLALAVEIGELGIFHIDLKTATGYYSPQAMKWFGLKTASLSMTAILAAIHPDDQPLVEENLALSIAGEWDGRHDFVYRVFNQQTGQLHYLRSIGQVLYENGVAESISGIMQNETDQMLSLKKIEESEERLRFALAAGHMGSWSLELSTMTLNASAHCKRNFGQPEDEPFDYETLRNCIHPDDQQRQQEYVVESLTTGKDYNIDYRVIWPDQSEHWLNVRGRVQTGDGGKPERMLGVSQEITQHVSARKKVEESETKYRSLFDSMDQGVCVIEMLHDANGRTINYRFLETNPVFEQQTGLKNATGKTALELVPNLEQHWFEIYGKVASTGEAVRFTQGSTAMGRMFDVNAFRISDGISSKVAVLFTDITAREKAAEALRHSEENLRNMLLQAPVAICIFRGPAYVIEIANERMFEFWGKNAADVLHQPLFEALPEAKSQGYEELMDSVLKTGQSFSARELPVTLPRNGVVQTVFINFAYEPLRETDGTVSGIMAIASDVTEQVLARQKIEEIVRQRTTELATANEALLTSNKELIRSNANLEEFAHAASHDLKEPVRKIHYFTSQLKEQLGNHLSEREVHLFNRIENASERMAALIDDLLLYSHVSLRPHEMETVDLRENINRVLEDLELDIQEKGATIQLEDLPVVQGYRRQLQQLFQNLISNAIKYSRKNTAPCINITAKNTTKSGQPYHVISVQDNGIGFEQEYAEKIFQMFSRLHGKNEYSGTGVGLSIVKKVIENHNGLIYANSKVGEGSVFEIYLPA